MIISNKHIFFLKKKKLYLLQNYYKYHYQEIQ